MASQGVVGVLTALSRISRFYASAGVTARILEKRESLTLTHACPLVPETNNT
jgi:hypothetical protein